MFNVHYMMQSRQAKRICNVQTSRTTKRDMMHSVHTGIMQEQAARPRHGMINLIKRFLSLCNQLYILAKRFLSDHKSNRSQTIKQCIKGLTTNG